MDSVVKFIASLVMLDIESFSDWLPEMAASVQSVSTEPCTKHSEEDECPYPPAAKMVCPAQSGPTARVGAGGPAFPTLFNLELPDLDDLDDEAW